MRKGILLIFFVFMTLFIALPAQGSSQITGLEKQEEETKKNKNSNIASFQLNRISSNRYPEATYIWTTLKQNGYNDYVVAGILGNIMMECGGQTLDLNVLAYNTDGYYGMCQWNIETYKVMDYDLERQCQFLIDDIENEFSIFAEAFNTSFDSFKNLEDERTAAYYFALIYERCDYSTNILRQNCATIAYEYFVH